MARQPGNKNKFSTRDKGFDDAVILILDQYSLTP